MEKSATKYSIENLNIVIKSLKDAFVKLSELLRNGTGGKSVNSKNKFGDIQLDTDLECDAIIFDELKKCKVVSYGLSEEKPVLNDLGGKEFIVTFDPLDGSSIIGTNFSVGTIFGIWPSDERKLQKMQVKDQIASGAVLYGSRTSMIIYEPDKKSVNEYSLKCSNGKYEWVLVKENIKIQPKGNIFAPGNLRAGTEDPKYQKCINYWIQQGYTLRYTGGMVPDIYQIFIKGQGVFSNIGSAKYPAKLRLLYEIAPLSFLVEKAGGRCSDGKNNLMDTVVNGYDQRMGIIVGSEQEVKLVEKFLNE